MIDLYLIDCSKPQTSPNHKSELAQPSLPPGLLSLHFVLLGAGHVDRRVIRLLPGGFTAPDLLHLLLAAGVGPEEII